MIDSTQDDPFWADPASTWRTVLRRQKGKLAMFAYHPPDPTVNSSGATAGPGICRNRVTGERASHSTAMALTPTRQEERLPQAEGAIAQQAASGGAQQRPAEFQEVEIRERPCPAAAPA